MKFNHMGVHATPPVKRTVFGSVKKAAVAVAMCAAVIFSAFKADAEPASPAEGERGTGEDKRISLRRIKEMLENAKRKGWTTLSNGDAQELFDALRSLGHRIQEHRPVRDTRRAFGYAPAPEDLVRKRNAMGPGDVYLGPRTVMHGAEWAAAELASLEEEYARLKNAVNQETARRALEALQNRVDSLNSRIAQLEADLAEKERELNALKSLPVAVPRPLSAPSSLWRFENLRPGHSTETGFFHPNASVLLHFNGIDMNHKPTDGIFRTAEASGAFQAIQAKIWGVEAAVKVAGPFFLSGGYTALSHSSRFRNSAGPADLGGEVLGRRYARVGYGGPKVLIPLPIPYSSVLLEALVGGSLVEQQVGLISSGRTIGDVQQGRGNEGFFIGGKAGIFFPKRFSLLGQMSNDPFVPTSAVLSLDMKEIRLPWTTRGLDVAAFIERAAFVAQKNAGTVAAGNRDSVGATVYMPLVTIDMAGLSGVFDFRNDFLDYSGGRTRRRIVSYGGAISFGFVEIIATASSDGTFSLWVSGGAAPKLHSPLGVDGRGVFTVRPGEDSAWINGHATVTVLRH